MSNPSSVNAKQSAAPEPHQLQGGYSYALFPLSRRLIHPVHDLQRLPLHFVRGVDVLPRCDLHALVAEPALDFLQVHARFAQLRRMRMPEAVEIKGGHP